MLFPQIPTHRMDPEASGITVYNPQAKPLFERARSLARFHRILSWITRRPRNLLLLSDTIQSLPSDLPSTNRIQTVSLRHIRGSVERTLDYDKDFYPMNDHLCDRWVRVASMILQGMVLPPVELIQVGKRYFVMDGHHRISVLRMMKYEHIDAMILAEYEHPSLSNF